MPAEQGFEGLSGIAEKISPYVHFPLIMRVVLPGFLATMVGFPGALKRVQPLEEDLYHLLPGLVTVLLLTFGLGLCISVLGEGLYSLYEGRPWPECLFNWFLKRQQRRLIRLMDKQAKAKAEKNAHRYREVWRKLRDYPLDDKGNPIASYPTRLGNLLASYEDYTMSRYGMDSVFYWTRLWLLLDREKKEEVDRAWSIADGLVCLSAVGFAGGLLWMVLAGLAAVKLYGGHYPLTSWVVSGIAGFGLLVFGYVVYQMSMPFHRRNGEVFKAVFDLHRDRLICMTDVDPGKLVKWKGTWSYLQYLRVYCTDCGKYFTFTMESHCPVCRRSARACLRRLSLASPSDPAVEWSRLSELGD